MRSKISIIGAGRVGTEAANQILRTNSADCILFDVESSMAQGKGLDLTHSSPVKQVSGTVYGARTFAELVDSEVVVITSGLPRSPGMSRDDLFDVNAKIIGEVAEEVSRFAPGAIRIVVTNPVDAMTYLVWKHSVRDSAKTIGMAGLLDSTRFEAFLAQELSISAEDIHALVIGSHGDQMIPLSRYASAGGMPITGLIDAETLRHIENRTRDAGTELVNLMKSGSAWHAAGASVAAMVETIINDQRRVICSTVMCSDHYGINGVCIGLPVILGKNGVERILPLELNAAEMAALHGAAEHNRSMQERVDRCILCV